MKRPVFTRALALAVSASLLLIGSVSATPADKNLAVCHLDEYGNFVLLHVDKAGLENHLAKHEGDIEAIEPVPSGSGPSYTADCDAPDVSVTIVCNSQSIDLQAWKREADIKFQIQVGGTVQTFIDPKGGWSGPGQDPGWVFVRSAAALCDGAVTGTPGSLNFEGTNGTTFQYPGNSDPKLVKVSAAGVGGTGKLLFGGSTPAAYAQQFAQQAMKPFVCGLSTESGLGGYCGS